LNVVFLFLESHGGDGWGVVFCLREHDFVILIRWNHKERTWFWTGDVAFWYLWSKKKGRKLFTDPLLRNFHLEVIFYKSGMGNMGRAGPMTVRAEESV